MENGLFWGFPDSSVGKESTCNAGDLGLIPGLGRSPGEGIGYPLQYSCASLVVELVKNPPSMQETWVQSLGWEDPLEKGKDIHSSILAGRIPWTGEVHRVPKSWTPLSDFHFHLLWTATLWTVAHQASLPMDFPGKNIWVCSHFFLQGIFPIQESNPCLLHWWADFLPPGKPRSYTLVPKNVTLFGNRMFTDVIKMWIKTKLYWLGWAWSLVTGVLRRDT